MIVPEYEPAFAEAAVLAALRGHRQERAFHAERDPLYGIVEGDDREAAFTELHACWFDRLGLDRALRQALAERPEIEERCARCLVFRASAARDEVADLLVSPSGPHLLLRLMPETLAAPEPALALLRHELLHVADMLADDFGYEPRLPSAEGAALLDHARAGRYRVLWDAYVDGRLVRDGRAPSTRRAERLSEFRRAFPALGERVEAVFERFFDAARCTHADLVAFVTADGERAMEHERRAEAVEIVSGDGLFGPGSRRSLQIGRSSTMGMS